MNSERFTSFIGKMYRTNSKKPNESISIFFYKIRFIFIILSLLVFGCKIANPNISYPVANQGILDLRDWDFSKNGSLQLKGEWEFYWKEFVKETPETKKPNVKNYISVPGKWNEYMYSKDTKLAGDGYGTYQLKIILPKDTPKLGFKIADGQGSAYELYINEELVAKNGTIGIDSLNEKAEYLPQYGKIPQNNELMIRMYISNHIHKNGGFQTALEIDLEEKIFLTKDKNRLIEIFLLGVLFIISLYHFSLYYYRRKDTSVLWFGLLCLIMGVRLMMTGERLFIETFPSLPFTFQLKLEYFGYYALVTPFFMFLYGLFPTEFAKNTRQIFIYIPAAFIALVLLSPIKIFTESLIYFQILTVIGMIFIMVILFKAVRNKRKGSKLITLGFIFYFITALNDLIFHNFYIGIGNLIPIGLFFFIFTQSAALAHRIADAFTSNEELSNNLELKVKKRTIDLEKAKSELFEMSEFTRRINSHSNLEEILFELTNYMNSNFNIIGSWLMLTNENKDYLKTVNFHSYGTANPNLAEFLNELVIPIHEDSGIIYKIYKSKRPFLLKKIPTFANAFDQLLVDRIGMTSFINIPLIRNNECIGILNFTNFENEMRIRKSDVRKISYICSQVAGSIDNNNLIEQVKIQRESALVAKQISDKQKKFTESLNLLIKSLNEDLDLNMIMNKVSKYIKENYHIDFHGLSTLDSSGESLVHTHSELPEFVSSKERDIIVKTVIPLSEKIGTHALAFRLKKPIYAKRVRSSALSIEEDKIHKILKFESLIVIPLTLQNRPIGFLDLYNLGKLSITKEEITYLSILGEQLAGIIYSSTLYREVEEEKEKSNQLLENILPKSIADELKTKKVVKPQLIESATVLFTDFVGFTKISENLSPEDLIQELDGCFSQFDEVVSHNNLEKLKTIGDAYMCAGGIPIPNETHVIDVCLAAMEFRSFMLQMGEIKKALGLPFWELRIGIHTGPVTAGVIGNNKFAYDIWGDTVNTASRMESSGVKGEINISGATYEKIKEFFECSFRGKIEAKGKGEVDMYFLNRLKPEFSLDSDGLVPNKRILNSLQFA